MLFGFWLIKVFKIERLGFFPHRNTFEVPGPGILTAWCYCAFWMGPEGVLFPGESQARHVSLHDIQGMSPGACFLFFPLGATACHAAAAMPVLGVIQWGQNEVNFFTCTKLSLNVRGTALGLLLAQKPWAHWLIQTSKSIILAPWDKIGSKGYCYWWLKRW